jgi:hypothetical protein
MFIRRVKLRGGQEYILRRFFKLAAVPPRRGTCCTVLSEVYDCNYKKRIPRSEH